MISIKKVAVNLLLINLVIVSHNITAIAQSGGDQSIDLSLGTVDMPYSSNRDERITVNVNVKNERNNEVEVASIIIRAYRNTGTNAMSLPVGEGVVTRLEPLSQKTITVYGRAPRLPGEWEIVTEITIREDVGKDVNPSNNKTTTFLNVN